MNLSVWESREAMRDYVYRSQHRDLFRRRAEYPGVLDLIGRLDAELRATYGGVPVGCGAIRRLREDRFEVKRRYAGLSRDPSGGGARALPADGLRADGPVGQYLDSPEIGRCLAKPLPASEA